MDWSQITNEQIQSLIGAGVLWLWCLRWAPTRALEVGEALEEPPQILKAPLFRVFSYLALALMLLSAYQSPIGFNVLDLDFAGLVRDLTGGEYLESPVTLVATYFLLWALPETLAKGRVKKGKDPGQWQSPALVIWRWGWLALTVLICIGYPQNSPVLEGLLDFPLSTDDGVAVAVAGAGIFLLWWGLPSALVARRAAKGNPFAAGALTRVRWRGLPSALFFFLRHGLWEKRAKKDAVQDEKVCCPHCKRKIDDPELYTSLKFDICPHCEESIRALLRIKDYIAHYGGLAVDLSSTGNQSAKAAARKPNRKEQDVVQRMMRAIFTYAVQERGTDLHLIREGDRMLIRCRTDGVLFTMLDLPESLLRMVISSIKVNSNMDIAERRKPQDGTFKTMIGETSLDVRVNTSPTPNGETASLRLLYRQRVLGSINELGMNPRNQRILTEAIARPHGLLLVTGPTGSGKSTTLYNILTNMADGQRNIITLEDPIEFKIQGVTQMQIEPRKGFTFTSGLTTILRQDPDVIMVGEIRDGETAKMAIDASMTGHLVLSTLHTLDTFGSINRLMDLHADLSRHVDALVLVIAQRLVRLICEKCAIPHQVSREELAALGIPGGPPQLQLRRGQGCVRCHGTGYLGRNGIYELLHPDDSIRELIRLESPIHEIRRQARARGMRTLLEDGLSRAIGGLTTIDEVLRVTH